MANREKTGQKAKLAHISEPLRAMAVAISSLAADKNNVRRHPHRNIEAIKAGLEQFGQQAPVVYVIRNRIKTVIKGNGVLQAAKAIGWKYLAAVSSKLKGNDAKAYAIADNRTNDLSDFDDELLAARLQELEDAEFDIEAAGFTDDELQNMVDEIDGPEDRPGRAAAGDRKKGPHVMRFVCGGFTFDVPRQQYDAWLSTIESKTGTTDADQVIKEITRRLKL